MSKENQIVGLNDLAKALHRTPQRIRQLVNENVLPQPVKRGRYDYWACHHAFIEYLDKLLEGQGSLSRSAAETERTVEHKKKLEKQNRKLDIEHQVRMGELIDSEDLKYSLADLFTGIKTQLRSIATSTVPDIMSIKASKSNDQASEIQTILLKNIDEALTDLSRWKAPVA